MLPKSAQDKIEGVAGGMGECPIPCRKLKFAAVTRQYARRESPDINQKGRARGDRDENRAVPQGIQYNIA